MKILMVAGESSGDVHGAALLQGLQKAFPDLVVYGIGGPRMLELGLRPVYTLDDMQVNGLVEVVRHLPRLYKILWTLRDSLISERPDAALLVDYPGFNLKLAAYVKAQGIPVLFFNSPQVWAWRSGRIHKIAQVVDKLIVQFPFEQQIYEKAGVNASFEGHPLVGEGLDQTAVQAFKQAYHLKDEYPIVALLPGSRPSEIARHLDTMLESLPLINQQVGSVQYIMPVADSLNFDEFQARLATNSVPVQPIQKAFLECIHAADAAIVSSGTATLQTGLALTPFVIIYQIAPLSYWMVKWLAHIPYFGMVNILAQRFIVRELMQYDFTPQNVAQETVRLLQDTAYRNTMLRNLQEIKTQLGEPGAYERMVASMVEFLRHRSP